MEIQITNVTMRYESDQLAAVQVYFTGSDENRAINLNGYIPLTADQYQGNESISALKGIVRQQLIDKLHVEA